MVVLLGVGAKGKKSMLANTIGEGAEQPCFSSLPKASLSRKSRVYRPAGKEGLHIGKGTLGDIGRESLARLWGSLINKIGGQGAECLSRCKSSQHLGDLRKQKLREEKTAETLSGRGNRRKWRMVKKRLFE